MIEPYYLNIAISHVDVQFGLTENPLSMLNSLIESPETALKMKENLGISFSGYDKDTREAFEIEELREFIAKLDDEFPYWLFFLSKFDTGLQAIFLSMMPLVRPESRQIVFPEPMSTLLNVRWLPALNQICEYTGIPNEIDSLTERSISYLTDGPFKLTREG